MMPVTAPTRPFTVQEYHKLGEVGILHEDDRIELLNGELVIMAPIGIRQIKAIRRLNRVLSRNYADHCIVDVKNPVWIDGHSEPQPDILLLRPEADEREHSPQPEDVLLLVEVAESSLHYDRNDKLAAYARNGIAEYWIVNLVRNEVIIHRDPAGAEYRSVTTARAGDRVAPLAFPETPIEVSEILPR